MVTGRGSAAPSSLQHSLQSKLIYVDIDSQSYAITLAKGYSTPHDSMHTGLPMLFVVVVRSSVRMF